MVRSTKLNLRNKHKLRTEAEDEKDEFVSDTKCFVNKSFSVTEPNDERDS